MYLVVSLNQKSLHDETERDITKQLYIFSEKSSEVMKTFDANNPKSIEPIPIKKLEGDIILWMGTQGLSQPSSAGFLEAPVYCGDKELDWEAYEICVEWCKSEGIRMMADLKNRVVP